MPLLVLLLVALVAGTVAWAVARRPPGGGGPRPEQATEQATGPALAVVVLGGLILAALALVVRGTDGRIGIDTRTADWADRHATAFSTQGLRLVTALGETWLVAVGVVVLVVAERRRARPPGRWVAPFLLAVVLGDKLLTTTMKAAVDRARPTLDPIAATLGPSFPSGHTSTAAAFWAAAALVAGRWCTPRAQAVLAGLAVGVAVGVAASRVLLDVHWLTDVVGGLALGWAWFAACVVALGACRQKLVRSVSG